MEGDRVQAEFNSSLEYLRRINEFFALCSEARLSLNSYLWASTLSCLFAELSTQMKSDEVSGRIVELRSLLDVTSNGGRRGLRVRGFDSRLYWRLYDFELFLRRVFRDSGLEMKVKADASNILFKGGG